MSDFLQVPEFARLADYCGPWLIEPLAARNILSLVRAMDLPTHMSAEKTELRNVTDKVPAPGGKSISLINLQGLLMKGQSSLGGTSTVQVRKELRAAVADSEVGGIVLRVDSPGGTVAGTYDLAEDVRAAARRKPLVVQVEDLAASAAVFASTWANRIYANAPKALYGSIGTYQVLYDTSAANESLGVKTILVATGPLKGMGIDGTKITDEQVAHVQGLINAAQEDFSEAVQKSRNLSKKELSAVTHGGVMTAETAIASGLIDGIQPLSKTITELSAAIKSGEPMRSPRTNFGAANVGALPMLPKHGLPMLTH